MDVSRGLVTDLQICLRSRCIVHMAPVRLYSGIDGGDDHVNVVDKVLFRAILM